jgi:transcriptional regulator with XRE-family HTH domain
MKYIKTYNSFQIDDDTEGDKAMLLEAIGKNIKTLRLKKGLTQEQVSEAAQMNPKYLGEIERGEKSPSGIVIYRLSQALGTSVCKILSGNNCPCIAKAKLKEVERLFVGKKKGNIEKAIKILEVFFE